MLNRAGLRNTPWSVPSPSGQELGMTSLETDPDRAISKVIPYPCQELVCDKLIMARSLLHIKEDNYRRNTTDKAQFGGQIVCCIHFLGKPMQTFWRICQLPLELVLHHVLHRLAQIAKKRNGTVPIWLLWLKDWDYVSSLPTLVEHRSFPWLVDKSQDRKSSSSPSSEKLLDRKSNDICALIRSYFYSATKNSF